MGFTHSLLTMEEKIVIKSRVRLQAYNVRKSVRNIIGKNRVLNKDQIQLCNNYWKPYYRHFSLDFHEWYTQSTGVFFVDYLPDDLYYQKIDPYFNNRRAAGYLDNKCLYYKYFNDINMPKLIACRVNGYWLDYKGNPSNLEYIADVVSERNMCFIKAATNSFGGSGVFCLEGEDTKKVLAEVFGNK